MSLDQAQQRAERLAESLEGWYPSELAWHQRQADIDLIAAELLAVQRETIDGVAEQLRLANIDQVQTQADLADAQARVKVLESLMHRATVHNVTPERVAEIRHIIARIEERYCEIAVKRLAQSVLPF